MEPNQSTPPLTDAETLRALRSAGVPSTYHSKTLTLQSLQTKVALDAGQWAKESNLHPAMQGGTQIIGDGAEAMRFTYLFGRAMVLNGAAVSIVTLPTLAECVTHRYEPRNADRIEDIYARDYIMILGATGEGPAPYPLERMFEIEWFMRNWISSGKCLILHGRQPMASCPWWPKGLASVFAEHCRRTYNYAALEGGKK